MTVRMSVNSLKKAFKDGEKTSNCKHSCTFQGRVTAELPSASPEAALFNNETEAEAEGASGHREGIHLNSHKLLNNSVLTERNKETAIIHSSVYLHLRAARGGGLY